MCRSELVLLLLLLLVVASPGAAKPRSSAGRYAAAEEHASTIRTWKDLWTAQQRFPGVDDGALAEAYSEFVVHTLATRWSSVPELTALTRAHPEFAAFVLRHVDASTDEQELKRVKYLATHRAPRGSRALCRKIARAAAGALAQY